MQNQFQSEREKVNFLIFGRMISILPHCAAARFKTIAIGVLLRSQSISIKEFNCSSTHFTLFYWILFHRTYEIGNIFTVLATCFSFKRFLLLVVLLTVIYDLFTILKFGQISERKKTYTRLIKEFAYIRKYIVYKYEYKIKMTH